MTTVATVREGAAFCIGAAALFFYCLFGAVSNHLWFPAKHAEVFLTGVSAWTLVVGSGAWLLSMMLMLQNMRGANANWMPKLDIVLIWVGVICLIACRFLPGVVTIPNS
jgi:hypothetical protein